MSNPVRHAAHDSGQLSQVIISYVSSQDPPLAGTAQDSETHLEQVEIVTVEPLRRWNPQYSLTSSSSVVE